MTAAIRAFPALWMAVVGGEEEEARQLLAGGANIEERGGEPDDLASPLQVAVRRGFSDMVQLLLEHGAEITVQDSDGDTLLHLTDFWGPPYPSVSGTRFDC